MKHRAGIAALISGFLVLVFGLALAPRLPADKRAAAVATSDPIQVKIDRAVRLVNSGDNPMEGISILREVLAEDSTQVDAQWHLAQFSITSRQIENAASRFQKVIRYDAEGKYPEAYFWLAQTKLAQGKDIEAVPLLETYLDLETDTIIRNGVKRMLVDLKK